jgi:membrane-associated phospholipid phosphatase
MVTAAMVAAASRIAPRLPSALLVYLAAVAVTRMAFGAHFPLDVLVGGIVGWEVGLFSVALVRAAGLLPAGRPAAVRALIGTRWMPGFSRTG